MKTLILRIGPKTDTGHDVALFVEDATEPRCFETPRAKAVIPADADLTPSLVDPETGKPFEDPETGKPLTGRLSLARFLELKDESPTLEVIGRYLFHLAFQEPLLEEWKQLRTAYPREDPPHTEGLRLVLDVRSRELEPLPWELLCDRPWRLFLDGSLVALRGSIRLPRPEAAPRKEWPLRALVVVGARETDTTIGWRRELESIEVAFQEMRHLVDYEVLRNPSRAKLHDEYARLRPHVFHFIGHGRKDVGTGKAGLVLDEASPPWVEELIANDLSGTPPPRLVILNACHSADTPEPERYWSLTEAFRKLGAAAVVGMRGEVPGDAAATFSAGLYKALAAGTTLDRAVQEARRGVYKLLPGIHQRDWALPSIWVSELPEKLLPPLVADSELLKKFRASKEDYERIHDFIDRKQERRVAIGSVEPAAVIPSLSASHLLVVTGRSNVGKTALILWCLEGCAHHGRRLAYVDLQEQGSKNFLEVLRAIKKGDPQRNSPIRQPLPPEAFYQFNQDLNFILKGQPPPPTPPPGPVEDEGLPFDPGKLPEKGGIEHIFKSFLQALRKVGEQRPLVLVLDNLRGVFADHFKQYIRPYLIDRIASGEVESVRMVLAVRDTEVSEWLNEQQQPLPAHSHIQLSHFSCDEFPTLISEFLRRRMPDTQLRERLVKVLHETNLAQDPHYTWDASYLVTLRPIVEAVKGGGK